MMTVSSVQNTVAKPVVASETKKTTLDYNSFLKLLVAEMKNQDPTNPTDTAKYISELASFSSVEQGVNTNRKLDLSATFSGAGIDWAHIV
jgi:flagellar basal-body rod modification protein FlgD